MASPSETETVIKRIIPYLVRRGYDVDKDFTFEFPASGTARDTLGFVDILVRQGGKIAFLVEAKRLAKNLSEKDRKQAVSYGRDLKVPFAVLTNGTQFECLNSVTGKRILWSAKATDKIPSKSELPKVLAALRKEPSLQVISLSGDQSLPYRPGLALKQLNALFSRCHNTIRKIEKNEDHAFSDFAKILFLKLLEEKSDTEDFKLPYSFRFYELAQHSEDEADKVKTAITSMLESIKKGTSYGDVIQESLYLNRPNTYRKIVKELAGVSLRDSRTDSKGAAFEYFVRATLKGKKLGQYFTPRPLIELAMALVGTKKVLNTLSLSGEMRVVDPACGTGGFLVFFMTAAIDQLAASAKKGELSPSRENDLAKKLRQSVFFGSDANEGVASSAKMNMIIAGDGHSNIRAEDTLAKTAQVWSPTTPDIDLIITNPPFGTTESDSLSPDDMAQFQASIGRGQILFLQKMIACLKPRGEICTVIDERLLNTDQASSLRRHILEHTIIRSITRLPDVTFKPNKINVKASLLHLEKREMNDPDLTDEYPVPFLDVAT